MGQRLQSGLLRDFAHLHFVLVSDFDIRISDFRRQAAA
jgi:hypothetical protein